MADANASPNLASVKSAIGKLTRAREIGEAGGLAPRGSERGDRTSFIGPESFREFRDATRSLLSTIPKAHTKSLNPHPIHLLSFAGDAAADKGTTDGEKLLEKGALPRVNREG